ncbi:MAG: hypothetical protein IPH89_10995 [Bacteroidetes bacterium]|nr:hypothetical protein [Bacteroidota bacterium]
MRLWAYAIAQTADNITGANWVGSKPIIFNSDDILGDGSLCILPTTNITVNLNNLNADIWNVIQYLSWDQSDVTGLNMHLKIPYMCNPVNNTCKYIRWDGIQVQIKT